MSKSDSRWKWLFAIALIGIIALYAGDRYSNSRTASGPLKAGTARLTYEKDDGNSLARVDRKKQAELWFRVVLDEAPLGVPQALHCEWRDPAGQLVRENAYDTKVIDHTPWE